MKKFALIAIMAVAIFAGDKFCEGVAKIAENIAHQRDAGVSIYVMAHRVNNMDVPEKLKSAIKDMVLLIYLDERHLTPKEVGGYWFYQCEEEKDGFRKGR